MIRVIGEKLKQYEKGRSVELILPKGVDARKLTFTKNKVEHNASFNRDGSKVIADIPDFLLMSLGTLTVRCEGIDDDGHKTVEKQNFTVHKGKKPQGYTEPIIKPSGIGCDAFYDTRYTEEIDNSFNYTFDGNLEGREYIEFVPNEVYCVKMSDTPITKEQLIGCVVKKSTSDFTLTIDENFDIVDNGTYLDLRGCGYSVFEEYTIMDKILDRGYWIDYIASLQDYVESISKTDIQTVEHGELKQLDEKYIPDTIARKEDIGDSASLTTTSKEIVGAINELNEKINALQS